MLDQLLERSSRTFALSIPLLPEPVRQRITIAYLMFRVADTFDDETAWPVEQRTAALRAMAQQLRTADSLAAAEVLSTLSDLPLAETRLSDDGYAELLESLPAVLTAWDDLSAEVRACIATHLARTIDGMVAWLEQPAGPRTIAEVRQYCYFVAGIVGELCTELFIHQSPSLRDRREDLIELAPAFGETLQLVNILRDETDDADQGRRYIPNAQARTQLEAIAQESLTKAVRYIELLEAGKAAPGIIAFNTLNLALAKETLALVARLGPGVKIPRERVTKLHATILALTASGESVLPIFE